MEYSNYDRHHNEPVDGFILQGPISDRDAFKAVIPDTEKSINYARELIAKGREKDVMPNDLVPEALNAPISAYRFISLIAEG